MAKKNLKERAKKTHLIRMPGGGYRDTSGKTYSSSEGTALLMEHKATLGQWKGGKKKPDVSYEGGQYEGGRVKGRKNLVRTPEGKLVNQHGVEFTADDKRALENAVNRANKKRMKMLSEEGNLPRLVGGQDTGQKVSQLQLMGKESDFILSRKSKSLQRFKSREDFEHYMDNLKRVNDPNYIRDRVRLYKRNHMTALENVFGDEAKDVMMKIRMMKPDEYMKLIQSDEMLEISYIYDPAERSGKLNQIRASLGMKLKEDDIEEEW